MKDRILRWGAGRVLNLDETLSPISHIKNNWTPLHDFAGKIRPQHVNEPSRGPIGPEDRKSRSHDEDGTTDAKTDLIPTLFAINKNNISGGIEGGAKMNRIRDRKPLRKPPRKECSGVQQCPRVSNFVRGCLRAKKCVLASTSVPQVFFCPQEPHKTPHKTLTCLPQPPCPFHYTSKTHLMNCRR